MSVQITLALLSAAVCGGILTPGYLADIDARYTKKPVINHVFKPPHPRPNRLLALVFLALSTFVPIFGLYSILQKTGIHIRLPRKHTDIAFLLSVFCLIVLLAAFFVALNLVQTVFLIFPILLLGWLAFPLQD